jgi:hypothetical protein
LNFAFHQGVINALLKGWQRRQLQLPQLARNGCSGISSGIEDAISLLLLSI